MTKLALVTGGAHPIGIGFASATALRKLGFEVIVTGYSPEEIALVPPVEGISARLLDVTDQSCQPARKTDPLSAPNIDPTFR